MPDDKVKDEVKTEVQTPPQEPVAETPAKETKEEVKNDQQPVAPRVTVGTPVQTSRVTFDPNNMSVEQMADKWDDVKTYLESQGRPLTHVGG